MKSLSYTFMRGMLSMFKEKIFYNQQYVIKQFENPTHVYLILDGEFQIIRRETRNQSQ